MKSRKSVVSSRRRGTSARSSGVRGTGGIALAPPGYGIPFVDRKEPRPSPGPAELKEAQTAPAHGLPGPLRAGLEHLSGLDLADVRCQRNSGLPGKLDALAYARGNAIHLAPGQERHLPHEAWHIVQQRQGRVKPTGRVRGHAVNDDSRLEREADVMGAKARALGQSREQRAEGRESARGPEAAGLASSGDGVIAREPGIGQAMAGPGAVVQRTLTVHTATVDYRNLRTAADQSNLSANRKSLLKQLISQANTDNENATDLATMVQAILGKAAALNQVLSVADRGAMEPVLRAALEGEGLTGFNLGAQQGRREASAFETLVSAAHTTSQQKGTTNSIYLQDLPGTLGTAVGRASVVTPPSKDIRGPHHNNSGWLPAVNVPARNDLTTTASRSWYDAASDGASAYVEVTVAGTHLHSDGWRVVYDFVNQVDYVTLHYHWHKGYNPFFELL